MSALTGSSAAARRAGRIPNNRPLATATLTAETDAHGGAAKSSTGNRIFMSDMPPAPSASPSNTSKKRADASGAQLRAGLPRALGMFIRNFLTASQPSLTHKA